MKELSLLNLIIALTVAFVLSNISILLLLGQGNQLKHTLSGMLETFAASIQADDASSNFYRSEQQIDVSQGVRAAKNIDTVGSNVYPMAQPAPKFPTPLNAVNDGMYASNLWEQDPNNVYTKKPRKEPEGTPASGYSKNSFNFHVY